jgi:ATP-dependent Zn protease
MLKESYSRVKNLLIDNKDSLQKIADALIVKETLLADEVI